LDGSARGTLITRPLRFKAGVGILPAGVFLLWFSWDDERYRGKDGETGQAMTSSVQKTGDGGFKIRLDNAEAVLSMAEVKTLLIQILAQMAPGAGQGADPAKAFHDFLNKLETANDVGIQSLIRNADDNDVLVLLKSAEDTPSLSEKLYRNMSDGARKMYQDDLSFRFQEGIPEGDLGTAASRLATHAKMLEGEGLLEYNA